MKRAAITICFSVVVVLVGCGGSGSGSQPIKTVIIGQLGGSASSTNGTLKLQIPAGALDKDVALTIQQIDAPASGAVGQAFEIGPSGTKFLEPITVVFHYRPADIGGNSPFALRVATYARRDWRIVPSVVNANAGLVSAEIWHFSPWSLVMLPDPNPPGPDDGGLFQGQGGASGSGSGGTSGFDAGGTGRGGRGGSNGGMGGTSGGMGGAPELDAGSGGATGTPDADVDTDPDA